MADQKKRGKKKPKKAPRSPDKRPEFPPFLDRERTRFLLQRVRLAARSPAEQRDFQSLIRNTYEKGRELEQLYYHLPGVLAGDRAAEADFRRILDYAARNMPAPGGTGGSGRPSPRFGNLVARSAFAADFPCSPEFFVRPDRIHRLTFGVERIAAGNAEAAMTYRRTLRGLWEATKPLDKIMAVAMSSDVSAERDRFADHMALLVRDSQGRERPLGPPPSGEFRLPDEVPLPDEGWPPPDSGGLELPPEPGPPPGLPPDLCEDLQDFCRELIAEGLMGAPLPTSVWADTIDSVEMTGCQGAIARIVIHGSGFGATQPANVVVLVDYDVATVEAWSDSEIVIVVPSDTPSGCVGFRDETIEAQRRMMHEQVQRAWDRLNLGLRCLEGSGLEPARLPYSSSKAPCTPFNAFVGTFPEIRYFRINGGSNIEVAPGTPLELTWRVDNYDTLRIRRILPAAGLDVLNPSGNSQAVGGGVGPNILATYELTASNGCGEVSAQVSFHYRQEANLTILGAEAVQVIQRFDLNLPADNNSVRLVAHKDTVLRVYLDSGIPQGLDDVTGRVIIRRVGDPPEAPPVGGARPFNTLIKNGVPAVGFMNLPGNLGGATPFIDREDLEQTLNFRLPHQVLDGVLDIHIDVYENGRQGDTVWGVRDQHSLVLNFQPRRQHNIVLVPIRHPRLGVRAPTGPEMADVLRAMVARLPMAEDAFVEFLVNGDPGFAFETDRDLDRQGTLSEMGEPWGDLFNDLQDFVDGLIAPGMVAFGLLVDDPKYNVIGGTANPPAPVLLSKIFTNPAFHTKARALAHEFIHAFGVDHANCPGDPGNNPIDLRLPDSTTDEPGINTDDTIALVPSGTRELMCWFHATDDPSWTSVRLWNILFDRWN